MDLIDKMLSQQKTDWMKEYTSNDENQQKSHIFKNTMSSYKRITKREKKTTNYLNRYLPTERSKLVKNISHPTTNQRNTYCQTVRSSLIRF